jgi:hypothetical protein
LPSHYLPLTAITLRDEGDRVVAEADGELIWPVYHATRAVVPPWDVVSRWLLRASPRPARSRWRTLGWSLPGWPERDRMPRLTLGGGALVLSGAQWRLPLSELWAADSSMVTKCRAMNRLRERLALPRFVCIAAGVHDDPVPCDLTSLQTVALIDRYRRRGRQHLLVTELLPEPSQYAVLDRGHPGNSRSAAELLLRFPSGLSAAALAGRAADAWRRPDTTAAFAMQAAG